jgi:glycosyltransferase involved in cell wall biosynthesis
VIQREYLRIQSRKIPIQVQVHSELSKNYAKSGIRQLWKYACAKISLKLADSVRSTSQTHSKILVSNFKIDIDKIDAIPVPLSIDLDTTLLHSRNRPICLGFIGRLQKERNLDLLVNLVSVLSNRILNLEIVIVGDGKDKSYLQKSLSKIISTSRVRFLGNLDGVDLDSAWKQIGVLVSTAKNESYGRAIRESLCHGIPVLAHESLGTSSLSEENVQNWISIIKFPIDENEITKQFLQLVKLETNDTYLKYQKFRQSFLQDELAHSWIRLINETRLR